MSMAFSPLPAPLSRSVAGGGPVSLRRNENRTFANRLGLFSLRQTYVLYRHMTRGDSDESLHCQISGCVSEMRKGAAN
jgi:hypothetical protein